MDAPQFDLPYEPASAFRVSPLQNDTPFAEDKVLKRIPPNVWRNVTEVVILDDASHDPIFELCRRDSVPRAKSQAEGVEESQESYVGNRISNSFRSRDRGSLPQTRS
jgi:hypothetical protein